MKKLSHYIDKALLPFSEQFGTVMVNLLKNWNEIAGEEIAKLAQPDKITFSLEKGTLYLLVADGGSALKVQCLHPLILERIRIFLGKNIIHKIKIKQCF